MDTDLAGESFEEFRKSFSYGTRSDLNFKFLKSMSDEEASEFFRHLLDRLGDAYDSGDIGPMIELAYEAQMRAYAPKPDAPPSRYTYDDGPFTPTTMPVAGSTVGLVTSSGHFLKDDDPMPLGIADMTQAEAEERIDEFLREAPSLSEIPHDCLPEDLNVRHGGYDITSASVDRNVSLPVDVLAHAEDEGIIGGRTRTYFSFPGATSQGRLRKILPEWIDRISEEEPDVMLLVPL